MAWPPLAVTFLAQVVSPCCPRWVNAHLQDSHFLRVALGCSIRGFLQSGKKSQLPICPTDALHLPAAAWCSRCKPVEQNLPWKEKVTSQLPGHTEIFLEEATNFLLHLGQGDRKGRRGRGQQIPIPLLRERANSRLSHCLLKRFSRALHGALRGLPLLCLALL